MIVSASLSVFPRIRPKCPKSLLHAAITGVLTTASNTWEFLNNNETAISRSFMYFDELHKYIKSKKANIRGNIEKMDDYDIVHGIMAMTATPDVIWDKSNEDPDDYWKITIVNIAEHNECNYFGWEDMEFKHCRFCFGGRLKRV